MPRERDLLWESLVETCGADSSEMTKSERGRYNKALKELKEVGAKPEDIKLRAAKYRQKFPGADLTPTALVAHWSALKPPAARLQSVPQESGMQHWLDDEEPEDDLTPEERAANKKRVRGMLDQLTGRMTLDG